MVNKPCGCLARPPVVASVTQETFMVIGLNLNLNSLLVTRQMTLFHQGVRMGEKLVP